MNEMYIKVDFTKGTMRKNTGSIIVSGDYNSTTIYFEYDRPDGVKMLEIKDPNGTPIFVDIIRDGMIVLTGQTEEGDPAPIFAYGGEYIFEVSLWKDDSKLTSVRSKLFVEQEAVVLTDDIVQAKMPIFDTLMTELSDAIEEVENLDINAEKEDNVTTVTINHKDGTSSSVEILDGEKGEKGDKGDPGEPGKGSSWGDIEGDIDEQTDLIEILNNKANNSDIPDVSNFITKTVNDLTNYYLKSETYTKAEVTALIGAIQQFHYEIVEELPQTGANNILYLVPKSESQTQNVYDEYVYANNTWEKIGDTEISLETITNGEIDGIIGRVY